MSLSPRKILIVDDNPDFGGHQVMTAYGIEGILSFGSWEILAMLHPDNQKNRDRWNAIARGRDSGRLDIDIAPTRTQKFQAVRRIFQSSAVDELAERVREFKPSLILVIQGNIEQACSVFKLRGKVDAPIVSYIPVPHKHAEMGAKLGVLRDWTCAGLYSEPDGFIIISETLGDMLRQYGATGRIQIVENGIPLDKFQHPPGRGEARAGFNLPEDGFIWGQIGRTEYKQKAQDFALELFLERAKEHIDEHLVFLGSGPDSDALEAAAASHANVHCLPWTDNPAPFYSAINALLLPSRYEGVPLAMLEALANRVPVASTNRDGMRDWLPSEWRFDYRDFNSGLKAMHVVRNTESDTVNALSKKVWDFHTVECFQRAFNEALEEWL